MAGLTSTKVQEFNWGCPSSSQSVTSGDHDTGRPWRWRFWLLSVEVLDNSTCMVTSWAIQIINSFPRMIPGSFIHAYIIRMIVNIDLHYMHIIFWPMIWYYAKQVLLFTFTIQKHAKSLCRIISVIPAAYEVKVSFTVNRILQYILY